MSMNSREKFLFIVLAAVVILFGGFKLLIEPEMKNLSKAGSDLVIALGKKSISDNNIINIDSKKNDNVTLNEKVKTLVVPFFPELKNDKIHLFFNDIAEKIGISYTGLSLADVVTVQITNPAKEDKELSYPAKETANTIIDINNGKYVPPIVGTDTSAKKAKTSKVEEKPKDLIEMMTVTITFNGTYEQTEAMIDAIKNSGRICRVSSVKISNNISGVTEITISAECFGIIKFVDDPLSNDTLPVPPGKANPFAK